MVWYTLRMEGAVLDLEQQRTVNLLVGAASLEELLHRLHRRCEEGIDDTRGTMACGLKAALVCQLGIGQWDCWNSFREFERAHGRPYPLLTASVRNFRSSRNSSSEPSMPPASPDSSPT